MNIYTTDSKWKKTVNILKTGMSFIIIIALFLISFLANSCAETNLSGYFLYNESTSEYCLMKPKKEDDFEKMTNVGYVYIMGDNYYIVNKETTQIEMVEHLSFEKLPKEIYKDTIIQIKTQFISFSNFKKQVTSVPFWISTISTASMIVCAFLMTYGATQQKQFMSDEFKRKQSEYNTRVKLKPRNFNMLIDNDNLEEKRRVYLSKHNMIISKLKNKLTLIPTEYLKGNSFKCKYYQYKAAKLTRKLTTQLKLVDEQFVNENLSSLKVHYRKLHAENYIIDNISNKDINARKDYSLEKERKYAKTTQKVITSVFFATALTAFVSNLFLNIEFGPQVIITICSVLVSVCLSIYTSIMFEQMVFSDEILQPLDNKTAVLERVIKIANGVEEETIDQIIQKYSIVPQTAQIEQAEEEQQVQSTTTVQQLNDDIEPTFEELEQIRKARIDAKNRDKLANI